MKHAHLPVYLAAVALWFAFGPANAEPGLAPHSRASHVFFPQGGTQLDREADLSLKRLAQVLDSGVFSKTCIALLGYSDSSGSTAQNLKISEDRAWAVAERLAEYLHDPSRIKRIEGRGAQDFLNDVASTSPFQRRVAVRVKGCA